MDPDQLETGTIGEPGSRARSPLDWIPTTRVDRPRGLLPGDAEHDPLLGQRLPRPDSGLSTPARASPAPGSGMLQSDRLGWLDCPGPGSRPSSASSWSTDAASRSSTRRHNLPSASTRTEPLTRPAAPSRCAGRMPATTRRTASAIGQKVGGDTLAAAQVADRGQGQVSVSFTAPAGPVIVHNFCTGGELRLGRPGVSAQDRGQRRAPASAAVRRDVDRRRQRPGRDTEGLSAAGRCSGSSRRRTLVDENGTPVSVPRARIGLGIYAQGPAASPSPMGSPWTRLTEYQGYTVPAGRRDRRCRRRLGEGPEARHPGGHSVPGRLRQLGPRPGSANSTVEPQDGLTSAWSTASNRHRRRGHRWPPSARAAPAGADSASVAITAGKATKGKLVVALYDCRPRPSCAGWRRPWRTGPRSRRRRTRAGR